MPQVQVLPYVPSFGEKLASEFREGFGKLGEAYQKKSARDALNELMNPKQSVSPAPQQSGLQHGVSSILGAQGQQTPLQQFNQSAQNPAPGSEIKPFALANLTNLVRRGYGDEAAKSFEASTLEQQKLQAKEAASIRAEQRGDERKLVEAEVLPYIEKIASDREALPDAIRANEQVEDSVLSGNVGPDSLANFGLVMQELGVPKHITNMLQSVDSKEFTNGVKESYKFMLREAFRGTTNQREIDIAEAVGAEIGVIPEANLAAVWAQGVQLEIRQERLRLYDALVDQGVPRSKIPAVLEKQLDPFRKQIKKEYFEAIDHLRKKNHIKLKGDK